MQKIEEIIKIIAIVGPTASGKSTLAIKLAKKLNGEIINADSRQIYKYMNIGTAKDPDDDAADEEYTVNGVPVHLIDFVDPKEPFSVADFQKLAYEKIFEIVSRGKIPFLVGGTGLWVDSVCKGYVFEKGEAFGEIRKDLNEKNVDELYNILEGLNPDRANAMNESDRRNSRRLIRVIEKELTETTPLNPPLSGGTFQYLGYPYNPLDSSAESNRSNRKSSILPPDTCAERSRSKGENFNFPPDKGGFRGVKFIPYNNNLTKLARRLRKKLTSAEKKFWFEILKNKGLKYKFHRQKPLFNYIVDFYCPRLMLAVEIDGDTHAGKEDYDLKRTTELEKLGILVLRYTNSDVLENIEGVSEDFFRKIKERRTHLGIYGSQTPSTSPLSGGEICSSLTGTCAEQGRSKGGLGCGNNFSPDKKVHCLYLSPKIDFPALERRIYSRVDKMFEQGLLEENRKLIDMGYTYNLPSMSGIGYKEFEGYFKGEKTLDEVREEIKLRTRQYAKRQVTWFKRNEEIKYVDFEKAERLAGIFIKS